MTLSFPLTLTDRFAWIIREPHAAVAARIRFPPVTGAIIVFICARLRRVTVELEALAVKIPAGTYIERRRTGRRCGRPRTAPRSSFSPIRMHHELGLPPWRAGWLHRIAPGNAGVWAGALRDLFSDPEMAVVIAAVPRMRRILRPLCFMLGLEASLLTPRPPMPSPPVPALASIGADNPSPSAGIAASTQAAIADCRVPPDDARHDRFSAGAIFGAI